MLALRPSYSVRVVSLFVFAFLAPLSGVTASSDNENPNPDALWAGGSQGITKRLVSSGELLGRFPAVADVQALAVDPRRGSAWATDGRRLVHLAPDGSVRWSLDLLTDGDRGKGNSNGPGQGRGRGKG